jgi:prophage antirepressor-like protein
MERKMSSTTTHATFSENVFRFGDSAIRVILKNGSPWFVSGDICEALGYANPRKAVADHLDDDERGVTISDTLGGKQKLTIINESGLYALVLRSRKPEARKFAKWVTGEVLPSIRKTGSYAVEQKYQPPKPRRWCVCLDSSGEQMIKELTDDCYVMTGSEIANAIKMQEICLNDVIAIAGAANGALFRQAIRIKTRTPSEAEKVRASLKHFTLAELCDIGAEAYSQISEDIHKASKAIGA